MLLDTITSGDFSPLDSLKDLPPSYGETLEKLCAVGEKLGESDSLPKAEVEKLLDTFFDYSAVLESATYRQGLKDGARLFGELMGIL